MTPPAGSNPRRWPALGIVYGAGVVCAALFVLLNLSDWPAGFLLSFWQEHPIIGASLGALLLAGTVYCAYTFHDRRKQAELDRSVAAAARSGMVDYLVDVDVALALVTQDETYVAQVWPDWRSDERPLRWLRKNRAERLATTDRHVPRSADPRALAPLAVVPPESWRLELIDQAVRRISAGLRAWGPLMSGSRPGQRDLVEFGKIRNRLLTMETRLRTGALPQDDVDSLLTRCRELAWSFENEGTRRPELIDPQWRRKRLGGARGSASY